MNCRSLLPKIDELKLLCSNYNPNFIFCNETWLHSNIPDSLIEIGNYNLIRIDRAMKKGGGLCIFYRSDLQIELFPLNDVGENIETICFLHEKTIFILFYFPPSSTTVLLII